jgi:hypothetical protein
LMTMKTRGNFPLYISNRQDPIPAEENDFLIIKYKYGY